jgi:phosphoribosylamine--glycine ligase
MKVLLVGSGGREHALAWKLQQSRKVDKLFCAPGNGGIAQIAKCVNIAADDIKGLVDFATRNKIHLTIIGPEQPLALGIADEFRRRKLRIFGPVKKAAQLESSKVFTKKFLQRYHIPTAPFKVFETSAEAIGFCKTVEYPVVVKADGLAAGKGVIIVKDLQQATEAINLIMEKKIFGKLAGQQIVVESFLKGQEVSIMAVTDGKSILPFLPSQDHKQAFEGDKGPNTGGMGAFCPTTFVDDEVEQQINEFVLEPLLSGLRAEDIDYRGLIYVGLMLTERGPKVLEINCRFGDPETQAVLPLLNTDLAEIMLATVERRLSNISKLKWKDGSSACVVMTSKGYPDKYQTGRQINGLRNGYPDGTFVFHAGTKANNGQIVTSGGRVLGVVGVDVNLKGALKRAYEQVKRIKFDGARYRSDIGFRELNKRQTEVVAE